MKTSTKVIVILGILIIVGLIFFAVDYSRVTNNTPPIFCIKTAPHIDDGSIEYFGLGYKVNNYLDSASPNTVFRIGTWFMKFNNPFSIKSGDLSPDITTIKYDSKNIKTHLYIDNFNSPSTDIIKSTSDITAYTKKFDDNSLSKALEKYTESYFKDNVLVIVNIQESSGSNTNKVDRVCKINSSNKIDIFVKRDVAEIGTDDMAMWHLLVEIDKNDFGNTSTISVLDSTVRYL